MTEALEGKTLEEAGELFEKFHLLVTEKKHPEGLVDSLGKLAAFKNVVEFPLRVKCATLAWHTLKAVLDADTGPVCTEDNR